MNRADAMPSWLESAVDLDRSRLAAHNARNKPRQGYARERILKPAGYLFLEAGIVKRPFSKPLCLSPGRWGWARIETPRGLLFDRWVSTMTGNTPAMPLHDAHFGGFFSSGVCR